jgi:hypothetical protein
MLVAVLAERTQPALMLKAPPSPKVRAAIDDDRLAVAVASYVGNQEAGKGSDVAGVAKPSERDTPMAPNPLR